MSPASRAENIAEELAQSAEAMRAAAALIDLGLLRDAMSRLYYAVYHAALALLLTEDLEPSTHRGVGVLVGLHFIKTSRVPVDLGVTLRRIQGYREAADYSRGFVIPEDECRKELAAARGFVEAVEAYLRARTLVPDLPG